ncbi:MAG: hypothetical protein Q9217_001846 [Psora testacea]
MRFRLGLLQDSAAIDKQIAKEAAEMQAKKHKRETPSVKTEAQTKADDAAAAKAKEKGPEQSKEEQKIKPKPKIRPLSEAKAIDSGANFVSETFLLLVAIGCIVGERWYSSKKETSRREDVADRITVLEEYEKSVRKGMVELEKELLRLRSKEGSGPMTQGRILPMEVYELEEKEEGKLEERKGWLSWITSISRSNRAESKAESKTTTPLKMQEANSTEVQQPSPSLCERILHVNSTSRAHLDPSQTSNPEDASRSNLSSQTRRNQKS